MSKRFISLAAIDFTGADRACNSTETHNAWTYEDLKVWRVAMDLVLEVYRSTSTLSKHEIYGLTSQLRRAAVSVPSNIAEGKGRFSRKELLQFLFHARVITPRTQDPITIARELGYLAADDGKRLTNLTAEVGRLLNGLVNRFQEDPPFDTVSGRKP